MSDLKTPITTEPSPPSFWQLCLFLAAVSAQLLLLLSLPFDMFSALLLSQIASVYAVRMLEPVIVKNQRPSARVILYFDLFASLAGVLNSAGCKAVRRTSANQTDPSP
ncbi:hypothetical protein BDK51DRAFT_53121 [Blyttiomyces helicus]|uniref:Uncharacterized protein n=1 Tax=Blyttiomyces helicus TaxID=388810 RepID=A0A4P9WER9_9FUNG|nr:hypothetical protein BDK51DRAFT_53121 [Blyttiomyces helicus]|eukprot:RKO90295.1 hypothetical protein BDK51DRAFT_53121 [Blyttiomyces helicus]